MDLQKKIKAYGFDIGDEICVSTDHCKHFGYLYKIEEDAIIVTVTNSDDMYDIVIIPWDKVENLRRNVTGDEEKYICENRNKFGKFGEVEVEEEVVELKSVRLVSRRNGLLNLTNNDEED